MSRLKLFLFINQIILMIANIYLIYKYHMLLEEQSKHILELHDSTERLLALIEQQNTNKNPVLNEETWPKFIWRNTINF